MSDIVVVGSVNMDMSVTLERIPGVGETLLADSMLKNEGGKGANQAVAAARLGAKTAFIGCVGDDEHGDILSNKLKSEGVDCIGIAVTCDNVSGTAMIFIDGEGQNCIAVVQGANLEVSKKLVAKSDEVLKNAKAVLLQHEIPLETNEYIAELLSDCDVEVILNPAPAKKVAEGIYKNISVVIPNEYEAETMTGIESDGDETLERQADYFHEHGVKHVIITLGSRGAFVSSGGSQEIVSCPKVAAVDSVAAGDCFCGAFATARSEGNDIFESVKFAVKAASVSVTRAGAMSSLPGRDEI